MILLVPENNHDVCGSNQLCYKDLWRPLPEVANDKDAMLQKQQ